MMICKIPDCGRKHYARGWCLFHYQRWWAHSDPLWEPKPMQDRHPCAKGYARRNGSRDRIMEHVAVAETALGRPLPNGAEVHHINGKRDDNRPANLVICPSRKYHRLLHMRARALAACGDPAARRCQKCGQWAPMDQNFRMHKTGGWHRGDCPQTQELFKNGK